MSVLICARDADLEAQLLENLGHWGWDCACAAPDELESRAAGSDVDALVLDLSAHDLLAVARAAPDLPVIALLADGAPLSLVASATAGSRVLLRKPFYPSALDRALRAVLRTGVLHREHPTAVDPAMRAVIARVEELAAIPITTVISGEAGTGKTLIARWLHARSPRARSPLVEVACDAVADASHELSDPGLPRLLESAAGGALLLEEIGELAEPQQLELLRFLNEPGGARAIRADTRIVATTRLGIAQEVAARRLHRDLGTRLLAAEVMLPPLRARPADLPQLARSLAARAAWAIGEPPPQLDALALEQLRTMPFPGNLHELESLMQRAALLFPGARLDLARLARAPASARAKPEAASAKTLDLRELERDAIQRALAASGGDRTLAARALGIHVRTLRNKLRAGAQGAGSRAALSPRD